jgi:PAS domain S-box-containing protein
MKERLRALIVEDSHSDALLLVRELGRTGFEVEHLRVDNAEAMQLALEKRTWDIVISDFSMPNFSAPSALKLLQDMSIDIPFIIVSGTMGEETAVAAMKAGAHDYFPKGRFARLGAAINRELREAEERRGRKQAEQKLLQSETRFAQAFRANPSAIIISTLDKDIVREINPRFLQLFGYEANELVGKNISELGLWHNPKERQQQVELLLNQGAVHNIESQVQSKLGTVHQVLISCERIILDHDSYIMTFLHDISERKQAENELLALYNATSVLFKADNLLHLGQQIVQAVVDEFQQFDCGLILVDSKQRSMIRLARMGEQQVQTNAPLSLDGRGLVPEAIRTGKAIYVPDVSQDKRYVANDPRTNAELVIPLQTAKGVIGVLDLQSVHRNAFSERDQRIISAFAERAAVAIEMMTLYEEINRYASELEERVAQRTEELLQAKESVEAIFNQSSDAIVLIHSDGSIRQSNPAFNTLFGYEAHELLGQPLRELSNPQQAEMLEEIIQVVMEAKVAQRMEMTAYRKNKALLNVDVAISPISDYASSETRLICSFRDITERKQLEENLRQTIAKEQELSKLKTRFTTMVSHDFRNPLAAIQTSTDLLKYQYDKLSEEKRVNYLNKIQKQIRHLTDMLEDILLIGKADAIGLSFNPSPFDLENFCRNIMEEIQTTTINHRLLFAARGACQNISMDPRLLRQILVNLLSNAVKYSPNGGDIRFDLSCLENKTIFNIQDNGIGISEEDRAHLFEPYYRAENVMNIQGTGLGLSIVKLGVEAHGGTIQVETALSSGTAFIVTIPR